MCLETCLGSGTQIGICCHQNIPKTILHISMFSIYFSIRNSTQLFVLENTFLKQFQLQNHHSIPSNILRCCQRKLFHSHITVLCIYEKKISFTGDNVLLWATCRQGRLRANKKNNQEILWNCRKKRKYSEIAERTTLPKQESSQRVASKHSQSSSQESQSMTQCNSFHPVPEKAGTTFPALLVPHSPVLATSKHGPD